MRIGIFTLPPYINYGGILQAYALQEVLERMGHDVMVINTKPVPRRFYLPRRYRIPVYAKRLVKKIFINHKEVINREAQLTREYPLTYRETTRFIDQYIHNYYVDSVTDIRRDDFDAIVVGSDQLWRDAYMNAFIDNDHTNKFLAFAKDWNIKRYAYAASFTVDEWHYPPEVTPILASLAKKFIAISVREDSGVELCRKYLGVKAQHLLDPTLVLKPADYIKFVEAAATPKSDGDLFCYILDPSDDKTTLINSIAKKYGLKPFYIKERPFLDKCDISERCAPPVEKWLRSFMDAKFVVTDSFHGMAFSINFGKSFIAIGNEKRGMSRMSSIARMFGIEDHLLLNTADYEPTKSYTLPSSVAMKLDEERKKSYNFLSQIK